jgi:hypothetical protein
MGHPMGSPLTAPLQMVPMVFLLKTIATTELDRVLSGDVDVDVDVDVDAADADEDGLGQL